MTKKIINTSKTTYKIGDWFTHEERIWVIVISSFGQIILVDIINGYRWGEPIRVKDISNITQQEFESLVGSTPFIKIKKVNITNLL